MEEDKDTEAVEQTRKPHMCASRECRATAQRARWPRLQELPQWRRPSRPPHPRLLPLRNSTCGNGDKVGEGGKSPAECGNDDCLPSFSLALYHAADHAPAI